ncbi:GPP34 family phosphoprotein [Dactylosporangium sp. NPDC049525]|uniref:GOLPH3/VPS74 family protein n=1 Tax=Dactylosporangium sp. NPDC049525 TaxID=3154730 RepID=UPI0034382FA6
MLLADQFFCLARQDWDRRPLLSSRALGIALAGALLGELVLLGRIDIDDGVIHIVDAGPPDDPLAHQTLEQLLHQPQHRDVLTWLAYLATTATDAVGQRLVRAKVWCRGERRRLFRTQVVYWPADRNVVAWEPVRLAGQLTSNRWMGVQDVVLAGLVEAADLTGAVLWQPELRRSGVARLETEVARLDRPLRHLLAHVKAALGDAVLAPR